MNQRLCFLLFLAGFLALAPPGGQALTPLSAGERSPAGPWLHLRSGAFDPLAGAPAIPAGWQSTSPGRRPALRLVQFPGPIQDAWYRAMLDAGLAVVTYLSDYGYLVWGDEAAVTALATAAPTVCVPGPHSRTITASETWCLADSPHLLAGDVWVSE